MKTKELEASEDEGIQLWEEEQLASWLRREHWTIDELVDLLEGHGDLFPSSEEPYLRLLDVLPDGGGRYPLEAELARRVSVLLDRRPDEEPIGDPPERLLYNLLMLCAGLACPDQLAEPLHAMWRRKALRGEWEGLDLRYALSAALASNQIDSRMAAEWRAMLAGRQGEFLAGHEYDGFEGLLWMPESPDRRGEPFLDAIGDALQSMAGHLEKSKDRRPEFRSLIQRVRDTYPDRPNWDRDFVLLADRLSFQSWAVECLPSLFIEIGSRKQGWTTFWAWHLLVACLGKPGVGWLQRKILCSGYVLEVEVEGSLSQWLREIAPDFEERRRSFPYPSERGIRGAVADSIAALEMAESSKGRPLAASRLRKARQELLQASSVGSLQPDIRKMRNTLAKMAESLGGDPHREHEFADWARILASFWGGKTKMGRDFTQITVNLPNWATRSSKEIFA